MGVLPRVDPVPPPAHKLGSDQSSSLPATALKSDAKQVFPSPSPSLSCSCSLSILGEFRHKPARRGLRSHLFLSEALPTSNGKKLDNENENDDDWGVLPPYPLDALLHILVEQIKIVLILQHQGAMWSDISDHAIFNKQV